MLNKNGERELAYVVKVDDILPMDADKLECVRIAGWNCVCSKESFKKDDLGVFFEIDSKLSEVEPFTSMEFLASKKYRIKSQKIRGVISQGLLIPLSEFGWTPEDHPLGTFVTEELNVTYYVPDDNTRKKSTDKYKTFVHRKPWINKFFLTRWMMQHNFTRKIIYNLFGGKKIVRDWPAWVTKTDEERVQNMPWIVKDKGPWVVTEKVDGSSTTFTMRKKGRKYEYFVCSRNVVFDNPNKKCYYETNVYQEMSDKYKVEEVLKAIMEEHKEYDYVTLQGETYGASVQKRDYSLKDRDFVGFNFITSSEGRWNSIKARNLMNNYGIPWVPIVNEESTLPDSVDELILEADGNSVIDGKEREGLVYRSIDGTKSFKVVSNDYLLKYHS